MPAARLFRRMLVGWDASRDAAAALRAAAAIAGDEQGQVVALAVLPPGGTPRRRLSGPRTGMPRVTGSAGRSRNCAWSLPVLGAPG